MMSKFSSSRPVSFIIVTAIYIAATVVGIVAYRLAFDAMPELAALFVADFAATVFTWFWGLVYRNVSVYDPYWSVAPPVLLTLYALTDSAGSLSVEGALSSDNTVCMAVMLITITVWAVRLTANWAVTFKGLEHEDWRYTKYRNMLHPVLFQLVNFFGLNLMPTIVVFLAMVPAIRIIDYAPEPSIYTWIGAAMCLAAALIQHLADTSAHQFRAEHPGEICRVGLWKHGRHPNYFGEILMWWGVWMQSLALGLDWTIAGAVINTLMFLCISIPLMEKRQMMNKPGYADYRRETRILI